MGFISIPPQTPIEFKPSLAHNLLTVIGLLRQAERLEGLSPWIQNTAGRLQNQSTNADMSLFDGVTTTLLYANGVLGYLVEKLAVGDGATHFGHMMDVLETLDSTELQQVTFASTIGFAQRAELISPDAAPPRNPIEFQLLVEQIQRYREEQWQADPAPLSAKDYAALVYSADMLHEQFMMAFEFMWHHIYAKQWAADLAQQTDAWHYHTAQNYQDDVPTVFRSITGRTLPPQIAAYLPSIRSVVMIPTSHIGAHVIFSILNDKLWIGFNANLIPAERVDTTTLGSMVELYPVMNALADENRLKIVMYLRQHGEQNVGEIADAMHMSISTASRHLKLLARTNILDMRRDATMRYYALNAHTLQQIAHSLLKLAVVEENA